MSAPPILRGCRAAFTFLTRIPLGGHPYSTRDWAWVSGWFPVVGATLGGVMAMSWLVARPAGNLTAAALALGAGMLLTGAFHEDGLADSADALGGASDRSRMFAILKDSRIGSFGAAALTTTLLVRVGALVHLGEGAPVALLLTQCASRTPPVWLMRAMPYVSSDATSKCKPVARVSTPPVIMATAWPVLLGGVLHFVGALGWVEAVALAVVSLVVTAVCGVYFLFRAGGVTGDFLGATQQLNEGAMLVTLAWLGGPGL